MDIQIVGQRAARLAAVAAALWVGPAFAGPLVLGYAANGGTSFPATIGNQSEDADVNADVSPGMQRQVVNYPTQVAAGTVIIDTPQTSLYYVLGGGKAIRYRIGVGREGFTWSGTQAVSNKAEWPDWTPPPEMIARQPYLPRWVAGGESNPLGARAMYLGNTMYRIHGTNAPETIGHRVSSGCIRLVNADVIDLYSRVNVGTKVIVLPDRGYIANHMPGRVAASAHGSRVY